MACNSEFWQQDILIVILCTLNLHKKLLLNNCCNYLHPLLWISAIRKHDGHTECIIIIVHSVCHRRPTQHSNINFKLHFIPLQHSCRSVILNSRCFGQFCVTIALPFTPVFARITGRKSVIIRTASLVGWLKLEEPTVFTCLPARTWSVECRDFLCHLLRYCSKITALNSHWY